jgi:hypothetical protein
MEGRKMTQPEAQLARVRRVKVAGLAAGVLGAGILLSACFGPGSIAAQIGTGTAGYTGDGGKASAATLTAPGGVIVDSAGNGYVADTQNCVIRGYTKSSGFISTVAGNGTCGFNGDGSATGVELNHPTGLALGADGKLYIADTDNNRIRVEDLTTHTITTYAGSTVGAVNGDRLTAAKFTHPTGISFNASSDLYVADTGNDAIREIDHSSGVVSTIAGTLGSAGNSGDGAAATSALLNAPRGVTVDASDEIVVADTGNCRVRLVDTSGVMNALIGTGTCGYGGDSGDAGLAQLNHPTGIRIDDKYNIYIADTGNNRVRLVDPNNTITTIAGTGTAGSTGDDGSAVKALLNGPTDVALTPANTLWIADTGNNRVRLLGLATPPTTTIPASTTTTTTPGP